MISDVELSMSDEAIEELRTSNPVRASEIVRKKRKAAELAMMDEMGMPTDVRETFKRNRRRIRLFRQRWSK